MKWKFSAVKFRATAVVLLLVVSCRLLVAQSPDFIGWQKNADCVQWVDSVYNQLTVEERIGQFFMLPAYTQGREYNMDTVLRQIKRGTAGGVIFFKGNPTAQVQWTQKIQDSSKVNCFVAIDGEWGLAMRIDSTITFPKQIALGAIQDNKLIYEMGREIGRQCKRMGIHINFAPDVDVNNNPNNPVINDRSFGEDKYKVALKGIEYADGMQDEEILACAKHFPGHGDVEVDSHKDLPVITKSMTALDSLELFPFKVLFKNNVGSAMVAHLNIPAMDTTTGSAASLSKKIATNYLKDTMGFQGLVFSDALNMKGVSKFYKPGTVDSIAFVAGNDILVFSENAAEGIRKIKLAVDSGTVSQQELEMRVKKVLAYKYLLGLNKPQVIPADNLYADLNSPPSKAIRQKLYENCMTIAANQNSLLPFKNWDYKRTASFAIGTGRLTDFQKHISNFATFDFYNQADEKDGKAFNLLMDTLAGYDLVVIDIHNMSRQPGKDFGISAEERKFVETLSGRTKVVLVVFGNPYSLKFFEYMPWILVAYDENEASNLAAANALFGAEKISGKLPVTASKTFKAGNGTVSDTIYRLKIAQPFEAGLNAEKLKQMDEIIQRGISAKAFPGCQLLVAKDNKVVWNKSYGNHVYEMQRTVSSNDLYDLASITKVAATTLAIMKLYDEKKISLDKKVGDYLHLGREASIKHLKLRDVLTHQAGLKAFFMFYKETVGASFEKYYSKTPSNEFGVKVADSLFIRSDYPDSMWRKIAFSDVEDHPKYVYSDNDFYILQKIVEHVSGKKLDEYVYENFYKPMGLTRMTYNPLKKFSSTSIPPTEFDTSFRKQVVAGYVHDPGAAMYGGVAGHAGLFSNAFDLAALFQMLMNDGAYNGKQLLDSATIKLFTARQSKISRRGFGFDKPEPDVSKSSPCYDGVPLSTFGHTGFTGTCVWADPDNQLIYIFLSNRVYPNAENNLLVKMNIRTELQRVIYESLKK